MMRDFLDRQGNPLTLWQWSEKFANPAYRRVDFSKVGPYTISTVWIGISQIHPGGQPAIFETMVTGSKGHVLTERYTTEEEAVAGHADIASAMLQRASIKSEKP